MPLVRQTPIQSTEDLRTLYRALGVSDQTLARAIQYFEARSDALAENNGVPPPSASRKHLAQAKPVGRLSAASGKDRRQRRIRAPAGGMIAPDEFRAVKA
jgi:hypothetical protein